MDPLLAFILGTIGNVAMFALASYHLPTLAPARKKH